MRKDVKIGMAASLVVLLIVGWYFTRDDKPSQSIPLSQERPLAGPSAGAPPPAAPGAAGASRPERSQVPHRGDEPMDRNTQQARGGDTRSSAGVPGDRAALPTVSRSDVPHAAGPGSVARSEPEPESESAAPVDRSRDLPVLSPWRTSPSAAVPAQPSPGDPREAAGRPTEGAARGVQPQTASVTAAGRESPQGPAEAAIEKYTVKPGDSFAVLAEIFYGSQRYTQLLLKANPQVSDPRGLRPGMVITIPPPPEPENRAAGAASSAVRQEASQGSSAGTAAVSESRDERTYVVQKGDTFFGIAERLYGRGARWRDLFELNKTLVDGNPQSLRPGMILQLPKS